MAKVKTKAKKVKKQTKKKVYHEYHNVPVTEQSLTMNLNEDLKDAWLKVREFASEQGPQKIYASGKAIMFSKSVCYFFVRPKKSFLETVIFLKDNKLRTGFKPAVAVTKVKFSHTFKLVHADQVEGVLAEAIALSYKQCL